MKQNRYRKATIGMRWISIFLRKRRSASESGVVNGGIAASPMLHRALDASDASDATGVEETSGFSVVAAMIGKYCGNVDTRKDNERTFLVSKKR